jgi:hypothetical protein
MAALILPYVYLSTVLYLLSVVIVMVDTINVLLRVSAHIGVYYAAVYSPVDRQFNVATQ